MMESGGLIWKKYFLWNRFNYTVFSKVEIYKGMTCFEDFYWIKAYFSGYTTSISSISTTFTDM